MTEPVITGPGLYRWSGTAQAEITHVERSFAFGFVDGFAQIWNAGDGSNLYNPHFRITGPWHEPVEGWLLVCCKGKVPLKQTKHEDPLGWRSVYMREVQPPHDEASK